MSIRNGSTRVSGGLSVDGDMSVVGGLTMSEVTAPSGEKRQIRTAGWLSVNDGQSLLNACIAGLGIAYLPSYLYSDAMKQGLVEDAIPDLPVETQGIYAVYPPGRFTQPKVRAFIDFLVHKFADKGPADW